MSASSVVFRNGPVDGVLVQPLKRHDDGRGWLVEMFRVDELEPPLHPAMAYVSETRPGVTRGPHEHRRQTDCFAFFGPGDFTLYLWDTRRESRTFGRRQVILLGQSSPHRVLVPPGVVHAYKNVSETPGLVFNAPNQLYAGRGRREPVDEIRHENLQNSPFLLD